MHKSLRRDRDTEEAHLRPCFHIDQIRALPDVHLHYSKIIKSDKNNWIVDPDVKPNPYSEESPEYKDHERYRNFHEYFRPLLPKDVTQDKAVYPIGYLEICCNMFKIYRFYERIENDKFCFQNHQKNCCQSRVFQDFPLCDGSSKICVGKK